MKKWICLLLSLVVLTGLCACGAKQTEPKPTQEPAQETGELTENQAPAQMANPWRDISEDEARELCAKSFVVPDGAENVQWSVLDSAADSSGIPGALIQLSFDLYVNHFTAREQVTGDEEVDQSGMYYDWTYQIDETMRNWADTVCHSYRWIGETGYADLCTWYDAEAGISYSLSVTAEDLDGFDLLAIAEALHGG